MSSWESSTEGQRLSGCYVVADYQATPSEGIQVVTRP